MGVFVPGPAGCQDHVAAGHRARLAVDHGDRAFAFQDEPQCGHGVPVRPRALARHQDLKVHRQRLARAQTPGRVQRGVVQHQHPALGVVHGGRGHGALDQRFHRLPPPHVRDLDGCVGPILALPQRRRAGRPHRGVEIVLAVGRAPLLRHASSPAVQRAHCGATLPRTKINRHRAGDSGRRPHGLSLECSVYVLICPSRRQHVKSPGRDPSMAGNRAAAGTRKGGVDSES